MQRDTGYSVMATAIIFLIITAVAIVGCAGGSPTAPEPEKERPVKCVLVFKMTVDTVTTTDSIQ